MEYVKSFNAELSALYEVKPPISKAKMTAITRGAIKAIKFYKHVVQSVEKFILKCKSEYKVPGLYVIDSIVRQSRHQFGCDKDVFAPRFSKNIQQTFLNLFKCPPEDKSKIIRVLNLWQKNQVFPPEVIQPLFDLADPNNPIHEKLSQQIGTPIQSNGLNAAGGNVVKGSPALQKTPTKNSQGNDGNHHSQSSLNLSDPNVLAQLQQLQRLLTRDSSSKTEGQSVHFDKKLLDFDYGDEEEEVNPSPKPNPNDSVSNLLTNPEVLRQLQTLQQSLIASQAASEMDTEKMRKLHEMKLQEDEFDKHLAQTVPTLSFAAECDFKPTPPSALGNLMPNAVDNNSYYIPGSDLSLSSNYMIMPPQNSDNDVEFIGGGMNMSVSAERNNSSADIEVINLDHGDSRSSSPRDDRYNRRHRSRSRSRDRREKDRDRRSRRSRSRSGSRSRSRRHRSRSRERDRERAKEKERETEREKERKKRGLPPIKKEHLSICSTTLWVGHLSKFVHQEDLSDTFGEFGEIVSIDLIPPRGCAFIVMNRRQDAARCLVKLKNHNLHGKAITLAWAPGKGVKGKDLKDYWEGDLGVSYIPWNKLKPDLDLELLEDGGMLDEDTMPAWMKTKISQTQRKVDDSGAGLLALAATPSISGSVDTSQPPPLHGAGLIQPPPPMSMTLVPPPFQINRGLLAPPVGINLPHGMMTNVNMTNVPLGVPPPNMPTTMMSLGLGSPFQGPPGLLPPPHMTMHGDKGAVNSTPASMKSLSESLMNIANQSFGLPMTASVASSNQEDNMDVEMEEVDGKVEREMQGIVERQTGGDSMDDEGRDRREDRDRRSGGRERDRSRERGDRGERNRRNSRDRGDRFRDNRAGRDRDRNRRDFREDRRDRDGRDPKENRRGKEGEMGRVRERNQDRSRSQEDRGSSRGRDRRDRKGSDSRWGENKDRHDGPPDENDRMEREKSLNDRLQEMAHGPGDRKDHPRDQKDPEQDEALFSRFEPPPGFEQESPWKPPSELDNQDQSQHSPNMPLHDIQHMPFEGQINSGPPNPVMMDSFISSHGMMGGMDQPPMDDFRPVGLPMDGPPMDGPHGPRGSFNAPPHGFMGAGPFEGPPLINGPPGMEPYFNGRGRGRGRGNFRGNFGPRIRGNGREFFPPRDDFFPRGMPGPRGGPRMMRPGFFPRGGMAGPGPGPRGMRGGPHWRDRGGSMRFEPPHYFDGPPGMNEGPSNMYNDEPQDRFDRPPDIYNETPEMFDGPPRRGPRFGRGGVKHGFDEGPEGMGRPDKRSRWGNFDDQREEYERLQREHEMSQGEGNTTPLRDEQPDMMHGQGESTEKEVKEDYREFQEAEPNYEEGYSQPGQDDVPPPSEVQESFNVPEEPVSVEENHGDVGDGAGVDTGAVDGATDVTEDKTEPVE